MIATQSQLAIHGGAKSVQTEVDDMFQWPIITSEDEAAVLEFQRILRAAGLPAFIRKPRGREIYAACGQLSRM